jgi:hypothetical protein
MKAEHPILFNGEMVRAVLANRKRVTRRAITPSITSRTAWWYDPDINWPIDQGTGKRLLCPYGKVGDLLWVRETWAAIWPDVDPVPLEQCEIQYRVDTGDAYPGRWPEEEAKGNPDAPKWRSSIHMPKWAARIWLEVTDVRAERVQDITLAGAIMEGCPDDMLDGGSPHDWFAELWDSINGKRPGLAWSNNPSVWVIGFK